MNTIYDVGMFDGLDTAYYLDSGFRVVAVEANPNLVRRAKRIFHRYLDSGQLSIVHRAVGPESGKTAELIIAGDDLGSSSLIPEMVENMTPSGTYHVETITLPDLIREHGAAYLVKVDIEGADRECVLALSADTAPPFLSFEANDDADELVRHAERCGYRRFKAINQCSFLSIQNQDRLYDRIMRKAMRVLGFDEPVMLRRSGRFFRAGHSSGPVPWLSDGPWLSSDNITELMRTHKQEGFWYDIHAARIWAHITTLLATLEGVLSVPLLV